MFLSNVRSRPWGEWYKFYGNVLYFIPRFFFFFSCLHKIWVKAACGGNTGFCDCAMKEPRVFVQGRGWWEHHRPSATGWNSSEPHSGCVTRSWAGWEKPREGDFNQPMGTHSKKPVCLYLLTQAQSCKPSVALPGVGFERAQREGAAARAELADPQAAEHRRQLRSVQQLSTQLPDGYLAQLDSLAWCSCSIFIQMGIFKTTWNACDCAGARWQFAGWGPALQSAGQRVIGRGGGSPWAGNGCEAVCAPHSLLTATPSFVPSAWEISLWQHRVFKLFSPNPWNWYSKWQRK